MMNRTVRPIHVGVVDRGRGAGGLIAYTSDWNLGLPDTCVHIVRAPSGFDAKRAAVQEHRARCMARGAGA